MSGVTAMNATRGAADMDRLAATAAQAAAGTAVAMMAHRLAEGTQTAEGITMRPRVVAAAAGTVAATMTAATAATGAATRHALLQRWECPSQEVALAMVDMRWPMSWHVTAEAAATMAEEVAVTGAATNASRPTAAVAAVKAEATAGKTCAGPRLLTPKGSRLAVFYCPVVSRAQHLCCRSEAAAA